MSGKWTRVQDVGAWLRAEAPQMRKVAHNFTGKVCHWELCKRCGLVALKNDATRKAVKSGCEEAVS